MDTQTVFDLAWLGGVIGFFLPLVISFVKRQAWSTQLKRVFAFFMAGLAGVVNVGVEAGWEFVSAGDFVSLAVFSIIDIYIASSVLYRNFWEGTPTEVKLASIGSS